MQTRSEKSAAISGADEAVVRPKLLIVNPSPETQALAKRLFTAFVLLAALAYGELDMPITFNVHKPRHVAFGPKYAR